MRAAAVHHSAYFIAVAHDRERLQAILRAIDTAVRETFLPPELALRMKQDYENALQLHLDGDIPMLAAEPIYTMRAAFEQRGVTLPEVRPADTCTEKDFLCAGHFTADELASIVRCLSTTTDCGFIDRNIGRLLVSHYQKLGAIRLICDYHGIFPADGLAPRHKLIEWANEMARKRS